MTGKREHKAGAGTVSQVGAFVIVHYQGRRINDLYVALEGKPIHCCQCGADLPGPDVTDHVWLHAPRRLQAKRKEP